MPCLGSDTQSKYNGTVPFTLKSPLLLNGTMKGMCFKKHHVFLTSCCSQLDLQDLLSVGVTAQL